MSRRLQAWSCGGGTQSAAIAALIVQGRLPKPDAAVMADTGWEKSATWAYRDAVLVPALAAVGVELVTVYRARYATVGLYGGADGNTLLIPAYTAGGAGKLPAFCSNEWKRRVVQRWLTERFPGAAFDVWIGYSADEHHRVRAQREQKWRDRYPLLFDLPRAITREECAALVVAHGWPPPRSACWMCPQMGPAEWQALREEAPDDFNKAVAFDAAIRQRDPDVYVHRSGVPLAMADLSYDPPPTQGDLLSCVGGCFT